MGATADPVRDAIVATVRLSGTRTSALFATVNTGFEPVTVAATPIAANNVDHSVRHMPVFVAAEPVAMWADPRTVVPPDTVLVFKLVP